MDFCVENSFAEKCEMKSIQFEHVGGALLSRRIIGMKVFRSADDDCILDEHSKYVSTRQLASQALIISTKLMSWAFVLFEKVHE